MSIHNAILGLLSWRPLTGYDLKKIMAESDLFYWSGNNNQIYNSLVSLHKNGLVTQETHYQENLPPKKVYLITEKGQMELRAWLGSAPELPEIRNTFLIQLALADALTNDEIDALLARYEEELAIQVRMRQEQAARPHIRPDRTPREAYLWRKITENIVDVYKRELDWVRQVRQDVQNEHYGG